jgi:hypothetical protein
MSDMNMKNITGDKSLAVIDFSAGKYDAFLYVDGFGHSKPGSPAAEVAPKWQVDLCKALQVILNEGLIYGIPIQEFLNSEIRPIETLMGKTLYELRTPNGYKKYAISHGYPEYRDFRMPNEDVLKIWEKYQARAEGR